MPCWRCGKRTGWNKSNINSNTSIQIRRMTTRPPPASATSTALVNGRPRTDTTAQWIHNDPVWFGRRRRSRSRHGKQKRNNGGGPADGPDEIDRIVSLLQRFRARRGMQQGQHFPQSNDETSSEQQHQHQPLLVLYVTLRLPLLPPAITERGSGTIASGSGKDTPIRTLSEVWTDLMQACLVACQKHNHATDTGNDTLYTCSLKKDFVGHFNYFFTLT
jgi:hypothetical protein